MSRNLRARPRLSVGFGGVLPLSALPVATAAFALHAARQGLAAITAAQRRATFGTETVPSAAL